jgi:tetratricopeptide (TPR) repeat protein
MKCKSTAALIAAAVSMLSIAARAQEDQWLSLMHKADSLQRAGQYEEAATAYRNALKIVEGSHNLRLADTLNGLANDCSELGEWAEAQRLYRRSLALLAELIGKDHPTYAVVAANLGMQYADHGENSKAEAMYRQAIAIYDRTVSPDDQRLALARSLLAAELIHKHRYDEAEQLLNLALSAFRKDPRTGKLREAIALNNLGVLRRYQGQLEAAIRYFEESIAILESVCGPDHPMLLRSRSNLAMMYGKVGRKDEADALFRRTLASTAGSLGTEHPVYAYISMNYAAFLKDCGRKSEARPLEAHARDVLRDNQRTNGAGMTVDVSAFRAR